MRKEEKQTTKTKKIFIIVSNEAGKQVFVGELKDLPDAYKEEIYNHESAWLATAYEGTDKNFRDAKNLQPMGHHLSHYMRKAGLEEVCLGDYL